MGGNSRTCNGNGKNNGNFGVGTRFGSSHLGSGRKETRRSVFSRNKHPVTQNTLNHYRNHPHEAEPDQDTWSLVDVLEQGGRRSSGRNSTNTNRDESLPMKPEDGGDDDVLRTSSEYPHSSYFSEGRNARYHGPGGEREEQVRSYNESWSSSLLTLTTRSILGESDSEDEELLFGIGRRRLSGVSSASSSSMSWAEDALDTGQTEDLTNFWGDIESVCYGNPKPERMSPAVYEECLEWRRAFPAACSLPSRFQFMVDMELDKRALDGEDDDDSTPTPTNEGSVLESPFFESRAEDCLTPNPETSSNYVSAWLSECQIIRSHNENENEERSLTPIPIQRPTKSSRTRTKSKSVLPMDSPPTAYTKPFSRSAYPTLRVSALTLARTEGCQNEGGRDQEEVQVRAQTPFRLITPQSRTTNIQNSSRSRCLDSASLWSRHSSTLNMRKSPTGEDCEDDGLEGDSEIKFSPARQRPNHLPLQSNTSIRRIGNDGVQNTEALASTKPVKPFMFWLFNNVSHN